MSQYPPAFGASTAEPTVQEKTTFRELCGQKRYAEAETIARSMTERFPGYGAGWKALGVAIGFQGRPADALAAMERAVKLMPADAGAHLSLGKLLFDLSRFSDAEVAYRQAIRLGPNSVEAHNDLGILLQKLDRFEEAETEYRHALRVDPRCAEAYYNLGSLLYHWKRYEASVSAYQQALSIKPDYAEAHYELGNSLTGLDRLEEAIVCFRRAIELNKHAAGQRDDMVAARIGIESALARVVPSWHAPMMNDEPRNQAYLAALQSAVTSKSRVFEIGTGSGLLAMMAARCGAQHVATCEAVATIAATAREIIAGNGLESSIQVIGKKSTDIQVGAELSQRANLLISEIVANDLLGEGILPSIEDAKRWLLEPGAGIIPASGSIMVALFGGEEIRKNLMVGEICGFDLGRFNSILQSRSVLIRQDLGIDLLTDGIEAFCFDFIANSHFPAESRLVKAPIRVSGLCHGIIQWIRLKLDDQNTYENHPCRRTSATSWGAVVYRFPESIQVSPGQIATVRASHDRRNSYLSLDTIE